MTGFLLAGSRLPPGRLGEVALTAAARQVAEAAAWHRWLRRWGLLAGFGLSADPAARLRACLVVLARDDQAASRLAAGWAHVTGYQVTVLPFTGRIGTEGAQ
jgi:hypothetical protein